MLGLRTAVIEGEMKNIERVILLTALASSLSFSLGLLFSEHTQAKSDALSVPKLEITDAHGRPRMVFTTDDEGTAKIEFVDPEAKSRSLIQQFRNGSMSLTFAGTGQQPAVNLATDPLGYGPKLTIRGNGKNQLIVLGFPEDDAMQPGTPSKAWGLFFPGPQAFRNLAAIGVGEATNSDERRGFVVPEK
jgi:hypothetical protein